MRAKFREMQQQMQEQMNKQANPTHFSNAPEGKPDGSKGDYIEFEEIK